MDWVQELIQNLMPFIYLVSILTFIWGMRKESTEAYNKMETKLEAWRQESNGLIRAIHDEIKVIQAEMKDFHGRLCAIESGRKEAKA